MKKSAAIALAVAMLAPAAFGQGRVAFNNVASSDGIKVSGGALNGQYVGASFTASLYWAVGTVSDASLLQEFSGARTAFFGATGGGPGTDGAGLFDGGAITLPGPGTTVTVQIRAWDQGSYDLTTGYRGSSALLTVTLANGVEFDPNMSQIAPFSVVPVPEPTTFTLAGLGAAAMLIIRRRK